MPDRSVTIPAKCMAQKRDSIIKRAISILAEDISPEIMEALVADVYKHSDNGKYDVYASIEGEDILIMPCRQL